PGTFALAPGTFSSGSRYFPIPHVGMTWAPGGANTFGFAAYGNGGMNTNFGNPTFGATPTGVDLAQMFFAPTAARRFGNHAIGATAVLGFERFRAEGLAAFGGFSRAPGALSNRDYDNAYGAGARFGYLGRWTPWLSVGAS